VTITETPAAAVSSEAAAGWTGSAFGLEFASARPIPGIVAHAPSLGVSRRTSIDFVDARGLDRSWSPGEAVSLLERRHADGRVMMTIDSHPTLGYRIYAPGHGLHVVSHDGRSIRSAIGDIEQWRWQRLMFAQTLPLAATLQGLALFHASGCEIGGQGFGFIASSGTGKTSLAVHLAAQGVGRLLTDDVLALAPVDEFVMAYPGPRFVSVADRELQTLEPEEQARVGRFIGRSDKSHLEPPVTPAPVALRALYFLHRARNESAASVISTDGDARRLIASRFIWYLQTPRHHAEHLDVAARLANTVEAFVILVPGGGSASDLAAMVAAHADSLA
jgi:hypothetical protein